LYVCWWFVCCFVELHKWRDEKWWWGLATDEMRSIHMRTCMRTHTRMHTHTHTRARVELNWVCWAEHTHAVLIIWSYCDFVQLIHFFILLLLPVVLQWVLWACCVFHLHLLYFICIQCKWSSFCDSVTHCISRHVDSGHTTTQRTIKLCMIFFDVLFRAVHPVLCIVSLPK